MKPSGPYPPHTLYGQSGLGLFTDLYELMMMNAYFEEGMTDHAVFSLYSRHLPPTRNFLLNAGLGTILQDIERLRFSDDDISYLATLNKFSSRFLSWLRAFRFSGDVFAIPEGTPVFANEPVLEVVAPLAEAQLIETLVMNQVHLQTVLATKAQRVTAAASGRPVFDFSARRAHGIDAALKGARAFVIGGIEATSNVLAGRIYGLPVVGTMAHSYIQAHDDEAAAFRAFARIYPDSVMLVDTYDTLEGVRKLIAMASVGGEALRVRAVRLDSGDLAALARDARVLLDESGHNAVAIYASGGLDERSIAALIRDGAPIDGFGVGTALGVSDDAPTLDMVYKLCEYAGEGRLKLSSGKPVLPGRKQVFRYSEKDRDVHDVIARADENLPGTPLLERVMHAGKRTRSCPSMNDLRVRARELIARLPEDVAALEKAPEPYPVTVSEALLDHQKQVREAVSRKG